MQNVLITGAAGFIGSQLATKLLNSTLYRVILADNVSPTIPASYGPDKGLCLTADLCDPEQVSSMISASKPLKAVFLFHGIMSSGSEADPDLSRRVNLDATALVLSMLAKECPGVRVIYASSVAIYGTPLPKVVTDATTPTPLGTYGTHKFMTELLINEMNRRGQIDAFSLRFPTISVRPGKPTQAASSFFSGMIREPMNGLECVVPLVDRDFTTSLCGPRTLVENLVKMMEMPGDVLPSHIRFLNMPGIPVTVQDMMDALAEVGGRDKLELLREEEDPSCAALLRSWPGKFDYSTALGLGLEVDGSFVEVVREYVATLDTKS